MAVVVLCPFPVVLRVGLKIVIVTFPNHTVKPVLSGHSKKDQKLAFKNAAQKYCRMRSKRAFGNTFDLH